MLLLYFVTFVTIIYNIILYKINLIYSIWFAIIVSTNEKSKDFVIGYFASVFFNQVQRRK